MSVSTTDIYLEFLGAVILIRCLHKECAQGIKKHFSAFISENWRSPDVIIKCDLTTAERKLFRAIDIDNALESINMTLSNGKEVTEWPYSSPLIPPYYLPPFKDRFVGLHAAAVQKQEGGALIIAGDRGSGKTTVSLHLTNEHSDILFLTDETVHIHKRSIAIEPFPIAIHRCAFSEDGIQQHKYAVEIHEACNNIAVAPTHIQHILFLDKNSSCGKSTLQKIQPAEIFKCLLEHHVDLGCNKDEALNTLFYIASKIPASKFTYCDYSDLKNNILIFQNLLSNYEMCL